MFIVLDTETTGMGPTAEIVEISLLRLPAERLAARHHEQLTLRLRPVGATSFPRASAVHGLDYTNDLAHCATFAEACPAILSFVRQSLPRPTVLVAHNAAFDRRMLVQELGWCGQQLPAGLGWACSLKMLRAARQAGELQGESCRLSDVYREVTGVELDGAHGAMADTAGLVELLQRLSERPGWQHDRNPLARLASQARPRDDLGQLADEVDGLRLGPAKQVSPDRPACRCGDPAAQGQDLTGWRAKSDRLSKDGSEPSGSRCNSFARPEPADRPELPLCCCGDPAVVRTVRKENRNNGREFYCCRKPQASQCGFFAWKADKFIGPEHAVRVADEAWTAQLNAWLGGGCEGTLELAGLTTHQRRAAHEMCVKEQRRQAGGFRIEHVSVGEGANRRLRCSALSVAISA